MAKSKALMSMADIEKRMSVHAETGRSRLVQTGGNQIGTRNERFTYKGTLIGPTFTCTVIDFVQMNAHYDGEFDPDNISIPGCFAISVDGDDMMPPENAPNRQSKHCDGCPMNAFGSAETGRGKACKNQYRLAVIPDDTKDARETDIAFITLPPTSIKPFNAHVQGISAAFDRPVWGVKTTFYFDNDDLEATFKLLLPKVEAKHTNAALLSSIIAIEASVREQLLQGPDVSQYEAPGKTPAKRKAAPRGKAAAKKKAAPKRKTQARKPSGRKSGKSKFS